MTTLTILAQMPVPSARSRPRNGIRPRLTRSPRIDKRRRQEGQAADHGDEHHADHRDGHRAERVDPDEEQAAERHRDGEATEEDRSTGRTGRCLDRGELGFARAPLAPEAGDHEQGVVHADGQADQHDELARAHCHRSDDLAVDAQDAKAGEQRREGQDERHRRRDRGTEGDEQDQEGGRQGELERAIEVVAHDLHQVFHEQCVVERVHLEARVVRDEAGEDRTKRRGLGRDGIRIALDRGDDPDARPIRRNETGFGRGGIRIHQVGEDGLAGIIRDGAQPADHVADRALIRGIRGNTVGTSHDQVEVLMGRFDPTGGKDLGGECGLGPGDVAAHIGERPGTAERHAGREQTEREHEPGGHDRPAVPGAPGGHPDSQGLAGRSGAGSSHVLLPRASDFDAVTLRARTAVNQPVTRLSSGWG